jgi:hypothetical protein
MPGYITQTLHKFQHPIPPKPQHEPHKHNEIQYGTKIQLAEPDDQSPPILKDGIKPTTDHRDIPLLTMSCRQHNTSSTA